MAKHQLKPEHEPTPGNAQAGIGQSRADNPAGKAAKAASGNGAASGKAETKADARNAEPTKATTTPDSHKQSATPSWKKLSFRPAKDPWAGLPRR